MPLRHRSIAVRLGCKVVARSRTQIDIESHPATIRRQKPGKESEFGHNVWLDEVDGGIVTRWAILTGNPPDDSQCRSRFYSAANEAYSTQQGVKRVILPKPGHKTQSRCQFEAQAWFKQGRRYHAGIEGRISMLKRKSGLNHALNHGPLASPVWSIGA